ncbi:MAG TPA: penicillin-binding protein 2 [Actinomycetota bacterium]
MEKVGARLRVLALLVAVMFVALTARLWFLQVLATTEFKQQARDNGVRFVYSDALRGRIETADGIDLVVNQPSLEVRVIRDDLVASGQAEEVLYRLSELLDVPVRDIRMRLEDPKYYAYQPKPVAEFVDERAYAYIAEHPQLFPGVDVETTYVRSYPLGRTAAHLVGTLNQITGEELQDPRFRGYGTSDLVGRSGLEQVYERWLRGEKGVRKFIVNADGETIRAGAEIPPEPGHDLVLALDSEIQAAAEEELRAGMDRARQLTDSDGNLLKATSGVVVVLDPDTGGVEAMVSLPSYDPAWYVRGLTKQQRKYLENEALAALLNRAMQGRFFPGSTFKAVSGLAAVKAGFASLSSYYPCTTSYVHPGDESGTEFSNWEPANTSMNLSQALVTSCDTWFYTFGSAFFNHWRNNQLGDGAELMQKLFREWGFGGKTGVDLPAEGAGFVGDVAWAEGDGAALFPDGWVPGGNILSMIGSSYLQATPLQLARGYMAIANRGRMCRPHVVDSIVDADGAVARKIGGRCDKRLPGYTEAQLRYVHEALLGVTRYGTAACAFAGFPLDEIPVAGKTGTAEVPGDQDTSWFASIVGPLEDPDHIVVAMVEEGGFGSQTAAPIVRRVVERIYGLEPGVVGCTAERED